MPAKKIKTCESCQQLFRGRANAITCSARCRKRLQRARTALETIGQEVDAAEKVAVKVLKTVGSEIQPSYATQEGFVGGPSVNGPQGSFLNRPANFLGNSTPPAPPSPSVPAQPTAPQDLETVEVPKQPVTVVHNHYAPLEKPFRRHVLEASAILLVLVVAGAIFSFFNTRSNQANLKAQSETIKQLASSLNTSNFIQNPSKQSNLNFNVDTVISDGKKLTATGQVAIQNEADSTHAFTVQNSSGKNVLTTDTSNGRVGIGQDPTGDAALQVGGDITASGSIVSTGGKITLDNAGLHINNVLVCTSNGCISSSKTPAAQPQTINVSDVAFLSQNQTLTGNKAFKGSAVFAGAFQVQDTSGNSLISVDSTNSKVGVNTTPSASGADFQVGGDINVSGAYRVGNNQGANLTCPAGDIIGSPVIVGGIIIGGSCQTNLAGSIPTFQQVYNSSSNPHITLNNASGTLTVQDAASPLGFNLFVVQSNGGGTKYFAVNTTGAQVVGDIDVTGQYKVNGSPLSSSVLADTSNLAKLNATQTFTGVSTFSNASNSFTGDGSGLSNVNASQLNGQSSSYYTNASNIGTGTLNDSRLSNNVALKDATQTFTGANTFSNASNSFTGNGGGLTSLNGSNISSGTVNDARLSSNVALKNGNNTFSGANTFALSTGPLQVQDAATPLGTDLFAITNNDGSSKYFAVNSAGASINGYDVCTSQGNCAGVGGDVVSSGGTLNHLAKFSAGNAIADSLILDDGTSVTIGGDLAADNITQNGHTVCDTSGNCVGGGGAGSAVGGSGTTNTVALFTAAGTIGDSILTQSGLTLSAAGDISATNINVTGSYKLNGTQVSSSILSNDGNLAKLDANQTFTGANTFSNASNSFTGDGSGLTALNGSNITSGTVADAYLSNNVAKLNANQTFTGANSFNNASNSFTGDGSNLTNLNGSNISTGTVGDARLSGNVSLLNANQTASGNKTFTGTVAVNNTGIAAFQIQNTSGSGNLFVADTTDSKVGIGTAPSSSGATLQVAGNVSATTGFVANGSTGSSVSCTSGNVLQNAVITGGIITGGTCVANGAGVSVSLQQAYNSSSPANITLNSTNGGLTIQDNSTPLGSSLFTIEDNGGSNKYLNVSASGVVASNLTVNNATTLNGSVLAKNSSDSATALQIQNAAGYNLLTADTSGMNIIVGQGNLVLNTPQPTSLSASAASNAGGSLLGVGVTYYYRVTAIVNTQETAPSNEVSIPSTSFTPLTSPSAPGLALTTGSNLGVGTYYYVVTFKTANGETTAGTSANITTTSGNQAVTVTIPTGPSGTIARVIYRTLVGGADGAEKVLRTINDNTTTSFIDASTDASIQFGGGAPLTNTARTNLNQVTLNWTAAFGATGYRIYRGTSPEVETAYQTSATNSFTDTGAVGTGATIQTITPYDRLGIGTNSPSASLDVIGTTHLQSSVDTMSMLSVQSSSGSQLLNADTTNMRIGVDVVYSAMSTPTGLNVGVATSGGSLSGLTTYRYEVTAIDAAGGETLASSEASGTTTSTNKILPVSWTAVTGATGYRVYRTPAGGASGSETYLATVSINSYSDSGSFSPTTTTPPVVANAYISANTSNSELQLTIGGLGTPTGQLYVSGVVPKDITNGGVPTVGSEGCCGVGRQLAIAGNYAYVATYGAIKLQVFDISNPAAPVDVSSGGLTTTQAPTSVAVQGRYAYVAESRRLQVFDISNPAAPVDVSSGGVAVGYDNNAQSNSIFVQGRYAYITGYFQEIHVFDISNPAKPLEVNTSSFKLSGSQPYGSYVQNKYLYVGNSSNKVQIFNLSNPANINDITGGGIGVQANAYSIAAQGNYMFVGNANGKFQIFDTTTPSAAVDLTSGGISISASAITSISIQGRYAYIIAGKLYVYDISNIRQPVNVSGGGVSVNGTGVTMIVQGRYAYVDTGSNRLQIFDLGGAYIQQLEVGSTKTSSLAVNSDANFGGNADISGGLQVGQSLQATGNLSTGGDLAVQGVTTLAAGITGGLTLNAPLSTPSINSTTVQGAAGSTAYSYEVSAVSASGGETLPSSPVNIVSGNATLSSSNYIQIDINTVTGAAYYKVYRTASGGTPSSTGYIGSTSSGTFNDTGLAASGSTATFNTTANFTARGNQTLFKPTTDSTSAFQVQNSSGASLLNIDSSNKLIGINGGATYNTFSTTAGTGFGIGAAYGYSPAPASMVSADLNNDGFLDLVAANSSSDLISVFLGNGDGTLSGRTDYVAGDGPLDVTTADFNGDGYKDIATPNANSSTVSVLLNNGNGTFANKADYTTGSNPRSVTAADFNGDGKPDIAVANLSAAGFSVLLNNGNGTFGPKTDYSSGPSSYSIASADFNGDGKPDIAISTGTGSTYGVAVAINNGFGFNPVSTYTAATGSLNSEHITAADFNGDGKPDIAAVGGNDGNVSIYTNNGNGTFAAAVRPSIFNNQPGPIIAADLTGDGKIDLATVDTSGTSNNLTIMTNNGSGSFSRTGYSIGATSLRSEAFGDFNGDGKNDLAIGSNSGNIYVANNGATTVTTAHSGSLSVAIAATGDTGIIIQGTAGQSGDLFRLQNSTGSELLGVTSSGVLQTNSIDSLNNSVLSIGATANAGIALQQNTTIAANKSFSSNGFATFASATNSTTAFQIQNSAGMNLLTADTTNLSINVAGANLLLNGVTPTNLATSAGINSGGNFSGASGANYYYKVTAIVNGQETAPSSEASFNSSSFNPVAAPATSPGLTLTTGSTLGVGVYQYEVTYVTANGETTGGAAASITTTAGNQAVNLTAIPVGPTGTTARKIYRTLVGGSTYKLLTTLNDNSTTTYSDTTTDASLGANIPGSNTARTNTNSINLSWTAVPGATNYKIYRGTAANGESTYQTNGINSFTDTGSAGTAATPPSVSSFGRLGIGTNSPTASLDVRGTALFKNNSDSVNAFQIQNASGNNVIQVDTANSKLYLGAVINSPDATTSALRVNSDSQTSGYAIDLSHTNSGGGDSASGISISTSNTIAGGISNSTVNGTGLNVGRSVNTAPTSIDSPLFDNSGGTGSSGGGSIGATLSNYTVGSQANRYLLAAVWYQIGSATIGSVTYNGVGMSLLGSVSAGSGTMYWYGLVAPASGSHNVVVNTSSGAPNEIGLAVSSWYNVNQTTPIGTLATTNATGGSASLNASTQPNQVVVDAIAHYSATNWTANSGQTALANGGFNYESSSYVVASGISTSMSWSGTSVSYGYGAVPLNSASSVSPAAIISGSLANVQSNCTVNAGNCTDTSTLLNVNQQYSGATGTVVNIQNSGSGAGLNVQNASGSSFTVGSSSITSEAQTISIGAGTGNHTINIGSGGPSSFPQNGVLDNFNRTNNATLGSNWTGPVFPANSSTWQVSSNQALDNHFGGPADNYRTDISAADTEAYFTIVSATGEYDVLARVQSPNTSNINAYVLDWDSGTNTLQLYKSVNNTTTAIGSPVTVTQAVGNQMGIRVLGSTITGYVNTGSGWIQEVQTTDYSITGAGTIGISAAAQNDKIDDFGGGALTNLTQNVTVGTTYDSSSLLLQAGAGNVMIKSSASTIVQSAGNSTTAFQIQNAGGTALFVADTTGMSISVSGSLNVSGNVAVGGYLITDGGMYATSLPGSPVNGQEIYYIADSGNEIIWHLRYNSTTTNWEYLGGSPLTVYVATAESTSTASGASGYVDLTTTGPSITLPLAGTYRATFGSQASSSGRSGGAGSSILNYMKLNIGGTLSGPDAEADTQLYSGAGTMNITEQIVQSYQFSAASASTNVKAQYQISAPFGSGSYSGTFSNRYLTITPVTVH